MQICSTGGTLNPSPGGIGLKNILLIVSGITSKYSADCSTLVNSLVTLVEGNGEFKNSFGTRTKDSFVLKGLLFSSICVDIVLFPTHKGVT